MKKLITILTTSIFAMFIGIVNVFAYEVGDIIEFGSWPVGIQGEYPHPIEWEILEKKNDGTAIILSSKVIDTKPYNTERKDITWAESSLRRWLNGEFYSNAFTPKEKDAIIETTLKNADNNEVYTQAYIDFWKKWGVYENKDKKYLGKRMNGKGGIDTTDNVWLLSLDDMKRYGRRFSTDASRIARPTEYLKKKVQYCTDEKCKELGVEGTIWWWLRSPGSYQYNVTVVSADGFVRADGLYPSRNNGGVRAALKINLNNLRYTQTNGGSAAAKKVVSETLGQTTVSKPIEPDTISLLSARRKNPDAIAVIIGAKNYDSSISAVEYAHNDASAIKDLAIRTLGYDPENIIYETDPTKGRLEQIFGTKDSHEGMLYNWIKPGKSDVLVYYTGHGAPDQKTKSAYFVPKDANPDYIKIGGYSMETLYANLAKMPAKSITVITDACFSGQGGNGKMIIKSASPLAITAKIPVANNGTNSKMTVFNAGKGDEIASWYDAKQHSLFTYYFLLGMSGQADTNNDKTITAGEIDAFLQDKVPYRARRMYNREQHPVFIGNPNAPLATYK